jgi:hypothetical protein
LVFAFVFLEPRARTSTISVTGLKVSTGTSPVAGPVLQGPVTPELEAAPGAAPTLGPRLGLPGSLAIGAGRLRAPPRGAVVGA